MKFSIIVPTRNRYHLLRKNLQRLLSLNYPSNSYEIIIVNNSIETDQTQLFIEKMSKLHKNVRFFQEPNLGPSFARNSGIKMAKFPFQIFIDDDIGVPSSLLNDFKITWEAHPNAVIIGGRIITQPLSGELTETEKKLISQHSWVFGQQDKGSQERLIQKDEMLLSGTFGIHQKPNQVFLFDTNLGISVNSKTVIYGEDFELCKRVVWSNNEIWYNPSIKTINYIDKERLKSHYLSRRYFINGIEIYIADLLLKKKFPEYNYSYRNQILNSFFKLPFLNLSLFKRFLRTKYDPIMMLSYFFCGKYFYN